MNNQITKTKAEIVSVAFRPKPFENIITVIEQEAKKGGDLFVLPETCLGTEIILDTDGPQCNAVTCIAKKYGVYIVFPVYRKTAEHPRLNSSIVFDRQGKIAMIYDKAYPYWSEFDLLPPAAPGKEVPVLDTDFGRLGLAVCFDANFPAVFQAIAEKSARLVLWSSAYSAGTSLQAHAINHNYTVISSTWIPDCVGYDITGGEIFYRRADNADDYLISRLTIDMDRSIFHQNFNIEKRDQLLKNNPEIEMDTWLEREQWFTLRSKKEGVSVRTLAAQYGMEELSSYKIRSRNQIDAMRGFKI